METAIKSGTDLISLERDRQISQEEYTAEHDAGHTRSELYLAAECYGSMAMLILEFPFLRSADKEKLIEESDSYGITDFWPWSSDYWKPSADPIRNLVKAGALLAAEIDRLQAVPNASS